MQLQTYVRIQALLFLGMISVLAAQPPCVASKGAQDQLVMVRHQLIFVYSVWIHSTYSAHGPSATTMLSRMDATKEALIPAKKRQRKGKARSLNKFNLVRTLQYHALHTQTTVIIND